MNTQLMMGRKSLCRIFSVSLVLLSFANTSVTKGVGDSVVPGSDSASSKSTKVKGNGIGYELSFFLSTKEEAQHQRKSVQAKQSKAKRQRAWIVFEYNPAALDLNYEKSEFAFVAIYSDGSTQAVRFGPYSPAIIGVYQGKLPKAEVALLLDEVRTVIPEASEIAKAYVGSCDADSFQLSITSQRSTAIQSRTNNFACLLVMPKESFELAQEMRTVWQRLSKVPLAYGYLRLSPCNEYLLKSAEPGSSRLITVSKLSRDRQAIIRNAIKHSPKYYGLNHAQYDQLNFLASDLSHFHVIDNGAVHTLTRFLSRKSSNSPQSLATRGVLTVKPFKGVQTKGWRSLVPLRSTRQDVERLIGHPTTRGGSAYQTASESVYVQYSDGPCEKGWPFGWNVARDTVLMITVSSKENMQLADLNLDETKYQKWRETHLPNQIHYTNHEEGIDIQADENRAMVISITFMPRAADSHLKCPDASRRLPSGRSQADSFSKFDAYGDISFSDESKRLDSLAAELQRLPESEGYIIAYAGLIAHSDEAKARAECAKNYLVKKHQIKAERILAVDGGYREAREVELYVEPRGGSVPLALPSIRPSKVTVLGEKKSRTCDQ